MSPRITALFAVLWTLYFLSILPKAKSSGVLELQIRSFRNDLGLTSNSTCCSGYRQNGICSSPCRTFFKVCLGHYQADIAVSAHPRCTFANYTTPVLGENSMDFSVLSQMTVPRSRQNTFFFPVREFSWPGDFSLIIEAWHDTTSDTPKQEYRSVLIARLAEIRSAVSGKNWVVFDHNFNYTVLKYAFRFLCDNNYYGANCADFCRPRDDGFGHYTCSSNGTKVCLSGWDGDYCDTAVCLPGCDRDNGLCDEPNECKCRVGWQGKFCKDCIPYPGCQRGHCEKPWQCNCEEGWGGLFCNQDLNFCTHHKPCRNGGVCTNTGPGGYTCTCEGSYTGVNCEREIDDCKSKPCVNSGVCKDIGNGFQCQCRPGFYGRQCEKEALSCKTNPCMYGGSCVEDEDSYYCLCQPGYKGFNCDTEVNECEPSPCLNGGRCIDQLNGYRCVCPTGYSGPECQNNEDDCHQKPCLNSGVCIDLVNDFRCQCVPGFVGTLCQDNVDDCEMRPCANGGRCTDMVNDFRCHCAAGFEGKDCSLQINECKSNPCMNGGICKDLLADYSCSCPGAFWGKNCHLFEGAITVSDTRDIVSSQQSITTTHPRTTVMNGDSAGQLGSSRQDDESEDDMSTAQLLIIVCLGGGIPLSLIIIAVCILLLRKKPYLQQHHTQQQNLENMAREKEHRYINNMNNKSEDIFITLPSSTSNSSSIKISNEEQQDINRRKTKHLLLGSDSLHSPDSGGTSEDPSQKLQTCNKQLLHSAVTPELPSTSSLSIPPSSSIASCSSSKGDNQSSDYDFEKPYRRTDVDSLADKNRRSPSEQNHHSQDTDKVAKQQLSDHSGAQRGASEHSSKDNAHSTPPHVDIVSTVAQPSTSACSLQPAPQTIHRHHDQDYYATEV